MSRLKLDDEEAHDRLSQIERELDEELRLQSTVEAGPGLVAKKKRSRVTIGQIALGAVGVLIAVAILKVVLMPLIKLALAIALIGGLFWIIGKLRGTDEDED